MKTAFNFFAVMILVAVTPSLSFALWDVETVSQERAKELGLEVRSQSVGPKHGKVELEFTTERELKDFSQVDLIMGDGDDLTVRAALREDRSKPGRVEVVFTAELTQMDKFTLKVLVPFRDGGAGGTAYELPVKDFVKRK